jgi:hypothetical protein
MQRVRTALTALSIAVAGSIVPVHSAVTPAPATASDRTSSHDFDFELGTWRVHHRVKRPDGQWIEFDGICSDRRLMEGAANVEEHRFDKPSGVTYGVAMRAYDPKSSLWATWWIDSRDPHGALDPPVKGRFENGIGTFYSDGIIGGKLIRTRFIWSKITRESAQWEQAYSSDAGKTWDTNWIMRFRRDS